MSAAPGFLEFFILEASEYVEQLDGLLLGGGSGSPDGEAMQRAARALRGTATMAKIPAYAELAAGIERVGRALQEGLLRWEPALSGAMVAAVDDLKALLHAARAWSPAEDRRARERANELAGFAPTRASSASPVARTPTSGASGFAFLATEAANIAAGLELVTTHAGDADTAANVLRRIRALRGVAGVKEVGPLADVLEAAEDAGRAVESGHEGLTPHGRRLLETSAAYLRTLSDALRTGGDVHAPSAARDAFDAARGAWDSGDGERERVIPIAQLFYEDGGGLVDAAPHPPTTASERFRLELVSLGEHLRQVVHAARDAKNVAASTRAQRDVRRALHALEAAAESFDEREVAEFVRSHTPAAGEIDFLALSALDDLASVLTAPGAHGERLHGRLRELAASGDISTTISAGFRSATPPALPRQAVRAPAVPPTRPAARPPQTGGARPSPLDIAVALIDSSIDALDAYTSQPRLPRVPAPDEHDDMVSIEALLYRGRAALERAVEIRDSLKRQGMHSDPDALEELFDLLELARAE